MVNPVLLVMMVQLGSQDYEDPMDQVVYLASLDQRVNLVKMETRASQEQLDHLWVYHIPINHLNILKRAFKIGYNFMFPVQGATGDAGQPGLPGEPGPIVKDLWLAE